MTNTVIFAIGTFGSKLLVYFMLPLYTSALTAAEYSVTDLIAQTANLLSPLICLGTTNSIIRFGLDKGYRKDAVMTTSLAATAFGFALMILCWPLLRLIRAVEGYTILIYFYVLMSVLRGICSSFVRAMNRVKLVAYDGIQSTLLTVLFTLLYLLVFKWGITGYVLAIVSADFCSAVFLFIVGRLWRFVRPSAMSPRVTRAMLRYSLPLIPASLFWWITNVSDRFMVSSMVSQEVNGLYSVSYKVPTLIDLLATIFMEAWQMSAISEKDSPARSKFFSRVFNAFTSLLFCAAAFLILTCRMFTRVLVADSYQASWVYIPVLVIATVFSCFSSFLNTVYMVERKSVMSLLTVMCGAICNIILNAILIPKYAAQGAAIATMVSYALVFTLRMITTRQMIALRVNPVRLGLNLVLVGVACVLMVTQVPHAVLWVLLLFAAVVALNFYSIFSVVKLFAGSLLARRRARG